VGRSVLAFVAFCFAASGTYLINDAMDREADAVHPSKRNRPVASGDLMEGTARLAGAAALAAALALSAPLGWKFVGVVGLYIAVATAYSIFLKRFPIVEMVVVATGFLLRGIGGGVAVDVPLSDWFLIVASFGSLLIVVGKRRSDQQLTSSSPVASKPVVRYEPAFLQQCMTAAIAVTLTGYCLWAFERAELVSGGIWYRISIIPFLLVILRFAMLAEEGRTAAPEDVAISDRATQVFLVAWIAMFAGGVYFG
jgi:decaprenyl-phosphate phosphoribosyltransferase